MQQLVESIISEINFSSAVSIVSARSKIYNSVAVEQRVEALTYFGKRVSEILHQKNGTTPQNNIEGVE